jgi:hypothetical protein
MATKNLSVAQRATYESGVIQEFLWWLSTAEKEIVSECAIDRNRYSIVGMIVLSTWLFATLAWTYFFSTAISTPWIFVPLGLFMGFIILCIDRALIKGIHAGNKKKIRPFIFRGMLALTIGIFMAQPAILYLFDKEIKLQISLDNETKKQQKSLELDTLYQAKKQELTAEKAAIDSIEFLKSAEVAAARENYIKEADGTGGTGKVGMETIARAKKVEYDKLESAYQQLLSFNAPAKERIAKELVNINTAKKKEEEIFAAYLNDGFLTRVEALNNLLKSNTALQYRYYLIVIILMLIELMPVIAKSMLPSGSYEEKAALREEMEKNMAFDNIQRETALKKLYNDLAHEKDTEMIHAFFDLSKEDREEKIRTMSARFRNDNHQSFDGMWEEIKKDLLSKQEN